MSVNVDIIVLINVLRQLTLSGCSHNCKRLKSQQQCQLHQFSKKVQKKNTPKGALCKYSHSFEERFECSGCHPIKHRFACFLGATVHSISLCD